MERGKGRFASELSPSLPIGELENIFGKKKKFLFGRERRELVSLTWKQGTSKGVLFHMKSSP